MELSTLKIIRREDVINRLGMKKTWLADNVASGLIPPPISLGSRAVGWPDHEINAVIAARAAHKSDEEVRDLVIALIEQRDFTANQTLECMMP